METNKVFQIALLVSVLVHGVVFLQTANFSSPSSRKSAEKETKVELRYIKQAEVLKKYSEAALRKEEPFLKLPSKITLEKTSLPQLNREDIFKPASKISLPKEDFAKPAFIKPDVIAIKKKITLAPLEGEKINSPAYIAHSQIVREKIKRALYQNYSRMETGQVYLTFVLTREGFMKNIRIVEEKSTGTKYLKEIALKSISDAAPFPNFPKELDYDQLTFNVIVSFEIE